MTVTWIIGQKRQLAGGGAHGGRVKFPVEDVSIPAVISPGMNDAALNAETAAADMGVLALSFFLWHVKLTIFNVGAEIFLGYQHELILQDLSLQLKNGLGS